MKAKTCRSLEKNSTRGKCKGFGYFVIGNFFFKCWERNREWLDFTSTHSDFKIHVSHIKYKKDILLVPTSILHIGRACRLKIDLEIGLF
jgi:hypothetical protein